jgi:uncharacterized protein YegP (UPF0339 family)
MIHLFKHHKGKLKGKYDIALIVRGKYIVGSNQGYENKKDAIKSIQSIGVQFLSYSFYFQDDTFDKAIVFYAVKNSPLKNYIITRTEIKPHKKHQP